MQKWVKKLKHYHSALGIRGVAVFLWAKLTRTKPLFRTNVPGLSHPVYLRVGTTDVSVFKQVLVEGHYDVPLSINPKVIVDAGANIGVSTVFFANRYPESRIIALEPEDSNFKLLNKNIAPYNQVTALKAALWSEEKKLCLIDAGTGHHGFMTADKASKQEQHCGYVEATTMDSLMEKMQVKFVDILKIDIEGAEKEVFEYSNNWIDKVGVIMAELHEKIKPGCGETFLKATSSFSMLPHRGETLVRIRLYHF